MGQGNAIAHLMPPPFYAYRYVVAKARAPEESIQDQIDKITDATATNRYKVEVMPGIYVESITMKAYVDVVAPYGRVRIQPSSGTAAVTMASNSMLQGVEVDQTNQAANATGIVIGDLSNVIVEDCWVTGGGAGDIGISDASTGTTVIIRKCRIDSAQYGYRKTGTGTTWFADTRVTTTLAITSMQGAVADDGGVQTDETTEANNDTANDMTLLPAAPAVNDAYYFGGVYPFQQLTINIGTAGVKGAGAWTITWEYWNGSAWATVSVTDGTSEFTVAGTSNVTFTPPVDWASTAVAGITAYWIRARVTAATLPITTQPLGTQSWVTDAIDIDVNAGTLNLIDCELMFAGTGANVDLADATITVNSWGNTLAGDGWRIADNANAKVFSHNDKFTKVLHAGAGFMVAYEEPQTYLVHNGMKIGDALTDITDAADTKRYTVRVFSGEYSEAVTMKQYIDLVGESNQSVVISQASATVITCAANSRVKNVRVEVTAADNTNAILCNNIYSYLEQVVVIVTHSANVNSCVASSGTGGFELHDCLLQIDNAASYPLYVDGSGNHFVYDSELINTGSGGYSVFIGAADSLNSFNNKLRSDEGFYLTSDTATQVLSYGDDFTSVVWSGATGLFADLTEARLYACAAGIAIGDWVYASGNDTVAEADADALATMPSIGRVVYKPSDTTCYVRNHGYAYDAGANAGHGDAWVAGQEYWISATAGEITTTMHPVWPQRAGVAVSTQRFKILVGDNLGLVHCNEYQAPTGTVAVNQWVYITTTNDIVGLAQANAAATMMAIGVCVQVTVGAPNDTILVKLRGKYAYDDAGAAWVASDDVYISDTVAGGITRTMPVGGIIQKVAEVKSYVDPALILELAD